ncbi:hypothetical protein [Burkholderia sp. F1]|uniref:hypothetical protein n=1 Tax=Burkholderia sp. F1 TaxID=3366817 RepID=UPI003D717B2C
MNASRRSSNNSSHGSPACRTTRASSARRSIRPSGLDAHALGAVWPALRHGEPVDVPFEPPAAPLRAVPWLPYDEVLLQRIVDIVARLLLK